MHTIIQTHEPRNTPKNIGRNNQRQQQQLRKRNFYHNQTQIQINERENAITTHADSGKQQLQQQQRKFMWKLQCQTKYWVEDLTTKKNTGFNKYYTTW